MGLVPEWDPTYQEGEVFLPQLSVQTVVGYRPEVERVEECWVCLGGLGMGDVGTIGVQGGRGRGLLGVKGEVNIAAVCYTLNKEHKDCWGSKVN